MSTTHRPLHPATGLVLIQPEGILVTDEDLVTLATAEAMFRGRMAVETTQATFEDASAKAQRPVGITQLPARVFAALARMAS